MSLLVPFLVRTITSTKYPDEPHATGMEIENQGDQDDICIGFHLA
jgi:hypothetical protein